MRKYSLWGWGGGGGGGGGGAEYIFRINCSEDA